MSQHARLVETQNPSSHSSDATEASTSRRQNGGLTTSIGPILCRQGSRDAGTSRFVGYFRVSTEKQGRSGLGLDAQRAAVSGYIGHHGGLLIAEFTEVETGKRGDRPRLAEALSVCRRERATLIIAKLDRLARNVAFIANLMEADVPFIAVDMPYAEKLTLHIFAAMAEEEARRIGQRTRAALAAAKARGTVLGANGKLLAKAEIERADEFARQIAPTVIELRHSGARTDRQLAAALNSRGVLGPRGGRFHLRSAQRLRRRMEGLGLLVPRRRN